MKKIIPLLLMSFLLTGCGLLHFGGGGKNGSSQNNPSHNSSQNVNTSSQNPTTQNQSSAKSESDILGEVITLINDYNYHFTYTININYSGYPEEYAEFFDDETIGPYEYDYDYPRVHVWSEADSINEYYKINNDNFDTITRYYQNNGVWTIQEDYSITGERAQVKYFDQQVHNVSDYVKDNSEDLLFKMTDAKLQENGFDSLYLKIDYSNNHVNKVTVDSLVSMSQLIPEESTNMTVNTNLRGVLTDFGNISVTLPTV